MVVLMRVLFLIVALSRLGIRVVSHQDSAEEQKDVHFPYVVSIQIVSGVESSITVDFYAAGALVSEKQALSVCHKFLESEQYWQTGGALLVVAGASKLPGNHTMESNNAQMRHVDRVIRHPKCQSKIPGIYGYDAAVLILKKPMLLNDHVQPIALKFKDLKQMEQELAKMEKNRVVCSSFKWGWTLNELPVTGGVGDLLLRIKRDENDTTTEMEIDEDTNTKATFTSIKDPPALENMTDDTSYYDFPVTGNVVVVHSYSEISVNKVLITSNDECTKSFCKAGQPACHHDFGASGQFCTTPWEMSNNTCLNYGGPLVCDGHLFGILDFELCFLQRTPSVYAGPKTILQLLGSMPVNDTSSAKESVTLSTVATQNILLLMIPFFIQRNNN